MTVRELMKRHDELELRLQESGPVQFIRDLTVQSDGAEILAQEARQLGGGKRSTRFLYRDRGGGEVSLTVITETDPAGKTTYWLQCAPLT